MKDKIKKPQRGALKIILKRCFEKYIFNKLFLINYFYLDSNVKYIFLSF